MEKAMETHSSILPGKSHGQRSLLSYGPQDCKGSDRTERAHTRTHTGAVWHHGVWGLLSVTLRERHTTNKRLRQISWWKPLRITTGTAWGEKGKTPPSSSYAPRLFFPPTRIFSLLSYHSVLGCSSQGVSGQEGYVWANACQKSVWMKNKRVLINSPGLCSHRKTKVQKSCLVCLLLKWDITVFKDFR